MVGLLNFMCICTRHKVNTSSGGFVVSVLDRSTRPITALGTPYCNSTLTTDSDQHFRNILCLRQVRWDFCTKQAAAAERRQSASLLCTQGIVSTLFSCSMDLGSHKLRLQLFPREGITADPGCNQGAAAQLSSSTTCAHRAQCPCTVKRTTYAGQLMWSAEAMTMPPPQPEGVAAAVDTYAMSMLYSFWVPETLASCTCSR